jgi:hypothetical protein
MSTPPPNENAPVPPPHDLVREARRLARLRHLHVVAEEARNDQEVHALDSLDPDPEQAA